MKISFGNNIASLSAARQLGRATFEASQSFERLATGLRINRAADDAAGLAVSLSLDNNSRLYQVAIANANDGLSTLRIMQSALASQQDILARLGELASQSSNGVYSNDQRTALQIEYTALVKEMGRIADSTSFNSLSLLRGTRGGLSALDLQIGINGSSLSSLSIPSVDTGTLSGIFGVTTYNDSEAYNVFLENGVYSHEQFHTFFDNLFLQTTVVSASGVEQDVFVTIFLPDLNDPNIFEVSIQAFFYDDVTGMYTLLQLHGLGEADPNLQLVQNGKLHDPLVQLGFNIGDQSYSMEMDLSGIFITQSGGSEASSALEFTGIETTERALTAMSVIENRRNEISILSGQIGSMESRLGSVLQVLGSTKENTSAALSRIRDADVAGEVALLVAASIKQQSAAAVLAQANAQPELLLSLLQTAG